MQKYETNSDEEKDKEEFYQRKSKINDMIFYEEFIKSHVNEMDREVLGNDDEHISGTDDDDDTDIIKKQINETDPEVLEEMVFILTNLKEIGFEIFHVNDKTEGEDITETSLAELILTFNKPDPFFTSQLAFIPHEDQICLPAYMNFIAQAEKHFTFLRIQTKITLNNFFKFIANSMPWEFIFPIISSKSIMEEISYSGDSQWKMIFSKLLILAGKDNVKEIFETELPLSLFRLMS